MNTTCLTRLDRFRTREEGRSRELGDERWPEHYPPWPNRALSGEERLEARELKRVVSTRSRDNLAACAAALTVGVVDGEEVELRPSGTKQAQSNRAPAEQDRSLEEQYDAPSTKVRAR